MEVFVPIPIQGYSWGGKVNNKVNFFLLERTVLVKIFSTREANTVFFVSLVQIMDRL